MTHPKKSTTLQQVTERMANSTTKAYREMMARKNTERAARIRRAVEHAAWQMLQAAPEPTKEFDGECYYTEHYWDIDAGELHLRVAEALDKHLEFAPGDGVDRQIATHCKVFLESTDFDDMVEDFMQGWAEQKAYRDNPYRYHGVSRAEIAGIH